jgi:hypothetical protein
MGGKVAAHAGKADVVWGDDDPWMRLGGWRLGIRFFYCPVVRSRGRLAFNFLIGNTAVPCSSCA